MFPVLLQIAAIVAVATVAVEEEEEIFILHVVWKRGSMEWRLSAVQAEVQAKWKKTQNERAELHLAHVSSYDNFLI